MPDDPLPPLPGDDKWDGRGGRGRECRRAGDGCLAAAGTASTFFSLSLSFHFLRYKRSPFIIQTDLSSTFLGSNNPPLLDYFASMILPLICYSLRCGSSTFPLQTSFWPTPSMYTLLRQLRNSFSRSVREYILY